MKIFNEKLLINELSEVPKRNQIIFALLAATRQLPNFEIFAKKVGTNYINDPRNILISLWAEVKNFSFNKINYSEIYDEVLQNLPEEESCWTVWHALADDALSSLAYTLSAITSSDLQDIVWAAKRAYEAADQVAIILTKADLSAVGAELELLSHIVVQRELLCQNDDLNLLKNELTTDVVAKIEVKAFDHLFLTETEIIMLDAS